MQLDLRGLPLRLSIRPAIFLAGMFERSGMFLDIFRLEYVMESDLNDLGHGVVSHVSSVTFPLVMPTIQLLYSCCQYFKSCGDRTGGGHTR